MAQAFRVGDWQIEPMLGRASKDDRVVHLRAKVMDLLVFLADRPGQVVSKDELLDGVWHSLFVSESAMTRVVAELRQALDDNIERPWLIETIPKRGYRLAAPVVTGCEPASGNVVSAEATRQAIDADRRSGRRPAWQWVGATAIALATAGVFVAVVPRDRFSFVFGPEDERIRLAVLPFTNLMGDPAQEYFSDGLTEELIAQLGRLQPQRLGVVARTTAMRYKNSQARVDEIGRELGVRFIVEGSVRRAAGRLRVTARLVRTADQLDLWVETYDRAVPEVFSIQQDIAVRVSRSLALTLLGAEASSPRFRAQATIPEAYEAFLLGLFHWNKATEQGARKSIEHFTEAIGLDPSYAPAYARLAFAHTFLASGNFASDRETYPKAIDAVQKALDIDAALGDAYIARGFVKWRFDWDWTEARMDIERGLDLDPNNPSAHRVFALYLYSIGDFDGAIAAMKNGFDLDPLNPLARWNLGRILFAAGQRAAAEREFRRAVEIEPSFSWPHIGLAWGLLEQGQHEKAVEELQRASRLSEGSAFIAEHLGYTYALSGKRAEAEAIARSLSETQTHDASAYKLAALHAALGNKDEALTWLARAVSARDDELVYLKVDRRFESLRAYPEFRDVIRSVAIPD